MSPTWCNTCQLNHQKPNSDQCKLQAAYGQRAVEYIRWALGLKPLYKGPESKLHML